MTLAEGIESAAEPKIEPVNFELWYREFYQEVGDERARLLKQVRDQMAQRKKN